MTQERATRSSAPPATAAAEVHRGATDTDAVQKAGSKMIDQILHGGGTFREGLVAIGTLLEQLPDVAGRSEALRDGVKEMRTAYLSAAEAAHRFTGEGTDVDETLMEHSSIVREPLTDLRDAATRLIVELLSEEHATRADYFDRVRQIHDATIAQLERGR